MRRSNWRLQSTQEKRDAEQPAMWACTLGCDTQAVSAHNLRLAVLRSLYERAMPGAWGVLAFFRDSPQSSHWNHTMVRACADETCGEWLHRFVQTLTNGCSEGRP